MQEFIFIFNRSNFRATAILLLLGVSLSTRLALADGATGGAPTTPSNPTNTPEEDDFKATPYTQYGEFNEEKDEEDQANFYQNGRHFGVSLGVGFETADGNRGALWKGGFPVIDFKMHYWFDFNLR